jgi:hypothetical protein
MYESNGPDLKIRGNASHIAEKYLQLARDAQSSGDPIAAENYYQHAEHYFRLIAAAQEHLRQTQPSFYQQQPQQGGNDSDDSFDDGDSPTIRASNSSRSSSRSSTSLTINSRSSTNSRSNISNRSNSSRSSTTSPGNNTSSRPMTKTSNGCRPSSPAASRSRRRNRGKGPKGPMRRTVRMGRTINPPRMATTVRRTASRCIAGAGVIAGRATIPCPMKATHRCRPADPRAKIDRMPYLAPGITFRIHADHEM